MNWSLILRSLCLVLLLPALANAQRAKRNEDEFINEKPLIGDTLPDLVVYDTNGKEVSTKSLRGHYTVLTFGCLT